ncbi:MAG: hypothetical protein ACLPTQ_16570 [Terriglobales bacterium]
MRDIIGFTLAETAFVLLFAVFAALLAEKAQEGRAHKQVGGQLDQISRLQSDLNSERRSNAELSERIATLLPKLRSSAFPSCAEAGKTQGWLFTATVRGKDMYDIEGTVFTVSALTAAYSKQLREAREADCRQRIRLYVGRGVSGEEYEYAMRQLAQYFYIGYMGSN